MKFSNWITRNVKNKFRWHVSGDVFSYEYAEFIALVCMLTPHVKFWIYTRSFDFLVPFVDVSNLAVNLSVDKDNYEEAMEAKGKYDFRICYLTMDGSFPELPPGSVIFPSHTLRGRDLENPTDAPWWQGLELHEKKMVCHLLLQ